MGDNLRNFVNQINVPLHVDEDGYFGRECPVKECLGYFKVTLGAGIKGPGPCDCLCCGHSGEHDTFYTQEQIDYARALVIRKVTDAFVKGLKSLELEEMEATVAEQLAKESICAPWRRS
jgi:hypothetical protein